MHSDIGGSYGADKHTGNRVSDIALEWMLDEATAAGLVFEPHIRERLTNGVDARLHRSRKHVFRLKKPLRRKLQVEGKPTVIHPSVKVRYDSDPDYRPKQLEQLVETMGWDQLLHDNTH